MQPHQFDPSAPLARGIQVGAMVLYAALKDQDLLDPDGQLLSTTVITDEFLRSLRDAPNLESNQ